MDRASSDNPLGLGLVIVGAVAIALAAFLPLAEPTGIFRMVENNTLIQHGGWLLIVGAIAIAASGYRVSQRKGLKSWVPTLLCVIAAAVIVYLANDKSLRTLYPVRPDGTVDSSQPGMVANLGIAIYVAGAGVAVALIGSLMLRQSANQDVTDPLVAEWEEAAKKKCPDCAETVLADARVCKHCGYRFAPIAESKTTEAKPRTDQPARATGLRLGDRVRVVAPGDHSHLKVGTVERILGNGDVKVKLGFWSGTYTFGPDELEFLG